MKPVGSHNYFVYIVTNRSKKILYTGVANDLHVRVQQHELDSKGLKQHFAGRYNCIYLSYWERYQWIQHAIEREKEIKGWIRSKKEALINEFNPEWKFLNEELG